MRLLSFLLLVMLSVAKVDEAQAAPPAWQANSAIATSTGADVTVTLPTHLTNDILLLQVVVRDTNDTITWPAGWAQIATVDRSTTARYWWAWKRAASNAETNPLVNKNTATGDTYAAVTTYRGATTTGDPWEVKGTPNTSTSAGHLLNGITTLTAESLIVAALCGENNSAGSGTTFSATNPASLAQVLYVESGTGANGACTTGAAARTTAGPTGNITATWTAAVVGSGGIVLALKRLPPMVTSINRASTDPTAPATAVAWTVIFSASMTGVDTSDFSLVQAGGVTGATITSVTGSGTTWTVNANTGSGTGTLGLNLVDDDTIINASSIPLGDAGVGNGNFTGQVYTVSPPFCSPPSNIPVGVTVTCVCDTFGRASLNPSTIFGGDFALSNSDALGNPYINGTTGLLRLTENTANNAKAATVPSIFPAAGNYISVEFNHYAYNGSNPGADGIAVTLSDYLVPAVPGGFGGSLGYAQRTGIAGFAGGWVGIALDEYGNYQNPTEGRVLGSGAIVQSVGVRGPGSGTNGYRWMGGTASNPGGLSIDNRASVTPAPGYMYQIIVDARNVGTGTVNVSVNRDATTKNGTSYSSLLIPSINAYTEANYALGQGWITQLMPDYWKISFTGSTGGANNIHEIGSLRICAQSVLPPTGGTASGFSAIDEAYPGAPTVPAYPNFQSGNVYMKLAGTSFKLWVGALTSTGMSTGYSASSNKYVQVKLVDNTDNACGTDVARTCTATCTNKAAVEAGASQISTFASGGTTGVGTSPTFLLNSSYKNLIAVMKECTTSACSAFTATTPACSADSFSVRPLSIASVTSSNATNTATTGTPIFKAGSQNFSLTATTTGVVGNPSGYTGIMKINNAVLQVSSPATVAGAVAGSFSAATSATPSSTATGTTFTYSEVGGFTLPGYNPTADTTSRRGVYDGVATADECTALGLTTAQCDTLKAATWTGIDSISTKADCVTDSYSNTKNAAGKYGCIFGQLSNTAVIGRFVPDHFVVSLATLTNRILSACSPASSFTYAGEQMQADFTLTARNGLATPTTTLNYATANGLAKLDGTVTTNFGFGAVDLADALPPLTATALTSSLGLVSSSGTWTSGVGVFTARLSLNRATTPDGPYEAFRLGIVPADSDLVTLRAADMDLDTTVPTDSNDRVQIGSSKIRFGHLKLFNAHGSELLDLSVPFMAQYFNGTTFITNTADSCTQVLVPSVGNGDLIKNSGTFGTTATMNGVAAPSLGSFVLGDGKLKFSKPSPSANGYVDITIVDTPAYLKYDWNTTTAGLEFPSSRATFGVYKGRDEFIYLRENY